MSDECTGKCYKIFFFILSIISLIVCIVGNFFCFKYKPYNEFNYKELMKDWKSSPISSISLKSEFSNGQISTAYEYEKNYLLEMFNFKYMDDSYDYEYLLKEDLSDKDYRPCGIDSRGNSLYLPNDIECPINEIEISNNPFPSKGYDFSTIHLFANYYLHYSNKNYSGYIINSFDINIYDKNDYMQNYDNYRNRYINNFPISFGNKVFEFFFPTYTGYPVEYNTGYERRNLITMYYIINLKSLSLSINIITFIFYVILFIFTILVLVKESLLGLHLFNMLLVTIALLLRIFAYVYLQFDLNYIFQDYSYIYSSDNDQNLGYFILIISTPGYIYSYSAFFSITTKTNIYYYLVYIIRYILGGEICGYCKRKRLEKMLKETYELHREIETLDNKVKELEKEKNEINNENIRTIKEIEKYKKILENKKRNALNNVDVNIKIVEEIAIEKKIVIFEKNNQAEVENLNKLKNQINEIEKEIKFYKFKKFQQLKNNGDE